MSLTWRLGLVLGLLTLTAGLLAVVPPVGEGPAPALDALAPSFVGWSPTGTVVESALPRDPHAVETVDRAYRNGSRTAWVSVALFEGQDEPRRRPSINLIHPPDRVARIERVDLDVALDRDVRLTLPAALIHRWGDRHVLVAHWHQIGRRAYGSEYSFRWALVRDILLARRGESVLVRIAVPVDRPDALASSRDVVAELAPPLYTAVAATLTR